MEREPSVPHHPEYEKLTNHYSVRANEQKDYNDPERYLTIENEVRYMKNTVRKITTVLLVLILTAGLIASAMADTVYITEGFVIPAERVGGARLDVLEPDDPAETPPDATVDDGTEVTVETQVIPEALDDNAEGLVVVDGEEKTEDVNITEQTEVRTNEADDNLGAEETITEEEIIEPTGEDPEITVSQDNETEQYELTEENEVIYLKDEDGNIVLDDNGNPISYIAVETEVTEEPKVTYQKDENGQLILDETGEPIPIVPEGMAIPVRYERNKNGELVLDENGDPIVLETVAYGSQKMVDLEDLLDPNRSVSIYFNYGDKDYCCLGDTVHFIAVLKGYDNAVYDLQWQYSVDSENWDNYSGEGNTSKEMDVVVDEINAYYWWRVEVNVTDVIDTGEELME